MSTATGSGRSGAGAPSPCAERGTAPRAARPRSADSPDCSVARVVAAMPMASLLDRSRHGPNLTVRRVPPIGVRRPPISWRSMSNIVVMKFGGTSVADAERIKRAARRIVEKREAGSSVVAVLSARGKTTDELIAMAEEVSRVPDPGEMDMLLSTGERISCALCAMAINDLGHRAISLTGSQAGIVTDESHTKALILDVRADRIRAALEDDRIVLVAGFQGVSTSRDVTTLGRGGSAHTPAA